MQIYKIVQATGHQVGTIAETDGTADVTDREQKPRLIIYSDGYGPAIHLEEGDFLVIEGMNLPRGMTERGANTFEPRNIVYRGPNEQIARLCFREHQYRHSPSWSKLKSENKPIPVAWAYYVTSYNGNLVCNERGPSWAWEQPLLATGFGDVGLRTEESDHDHR